MSRTKLTNKQKAFIEHYLECWNGTEAARKAGYKGNDNTLAAIGSQNLRKLNIKRRVQDRLDAKAMSANEILDRLAQHARGDISDYINDFGYLDFERLKKDGKAHLVKKYIISPTAKGMKVHVEAYDAQSALVQLAKAQGLFTERRINLDIDMENLSVEQLARIAAGENPLHVIGDKPD